MTANGWSGPAPAWPLAYDDFALLPLFVHTRRRVPVQVEEENLRQAGDEDVAGFIRGRQRLARTPPHKRRATPRRGRGNAGAVARTKPLASPCQAPGHHHMCVAHMSIDLELPPPHPRLLDPYAFIQTTRPSRPRPYKRNYRFLGKFSLFRALEVTKCH